MKEKIVEIHWVDACTHTGWKDDNYKSHTVKVITRGVEWENTKSHISVALSLDEIGQPADIISIPQVCVTKRKLLK